MLRKTAVAIVGAMLLSGVAAAATPIEQAIPDHMTGEQRARNLPGGAADARGATGSVSGYEVVQDHMTGEQRTRNLPGGAADARGSTGGTGWFSQGASSPFPRRGGLD